MSEAVPSVVAIDIGTHKVSVLIGKIHAPDNIQVIGMATARNRGMNKGKIVSLDKVIAAIKNAVAEAENMVLNVAFIVRGYLFRVPSYKVSMLLDAHLLLTRHM